MLRTDAAFDRKDWGGVGFGSDNMRSCGGKCMSGGRGLTIPSEKGEKKVVCAKIVIADEKIKSF